MTREKYFQKLFELFDCGEISDEVYDAMIMNIDCFCDEDDDPYGLSDTYAEVEYDDFDNAEAILGSRFDDLNYRWYTER